MTARYESTIANAERLVVLLGYTALLKKQNPATRLLVCYLANARIKKSVLTCFFSDLR